MENRSSPVGDAIAGTAAGESLVLVNGIALDVDERGVVRSGTDGVGGAVEEPVA